MKTRVITAVVGLAVLAVVLAFFDTIFFDFVLSAICLLAIHEVFSAMGFGKKQWYLYAAAVPFTLLDFFPKDFLLIVDESHVALPQVRGMFAGDRARKETLIEYGFRLPSALDNRPLTFDEFYSKLNQVIFVSATPGAFEKEIGSNCRADNPPDRSFGPDN